MIAMGVQHVVAMFGSTVLAPLLMGFDPNLCIFMSGIGTLLFSVLVGGRVPSYLGSSFAFIGLVIAVTGYGGHEPNMNIPVALGGIIACGVAYVVIGLNLAPIAVKGVMGSNFDSWMARDRAVGRRRGGVCARHGATAADSDRAGDCLCDLGDADQRHGHGHGHGQAD